jgi:hypothetical protein
VLTVNPLGFMDDHQDGAGRYDTYLSHALTTAYELFPYWPAESSTRILKALHTLYRDASTPLGSSILWGRSGGIHSLLDSLKVFTRLLTHSPEDARPKLLGLLQVALRQTMELGWRDDAIATHRYARAHWYLGPFRLLENSLLYLNALIRAALELQTLAKRFPALQAEMSPEVLFPKQDRFIPFDERGPGVWCYRAEGLEFQLPLVQGYNSDYVAAPIFPGVFEQICDCGMPCGVPVVRMAGKRFLPLQRPEEVRHRPGELTWLTPGWSHYQDWDWWKPNEHLPGERRVCVRVAAGDLTGEEHWQFPEVPSAVGMWFAASEAPLQVEWTSPHKQFTCVTEVAGMSDWRSHWKPIRTLHQVEFEPAREMSIRWSVRVAK